MTSPKDARRERALQRLRSQVSVTLSPHARIRARELAFHEVEVLACVAAPQQTYGGGPAHPDGRRIYQRGDCTAVVDESSRTVITVLLRSPHPWTHGVHDRRRYPSPASNQAVTTAP